MRSPAARCSHSHGSASRRHSGFVTAGTRKPMATTLTPAEKNARSVFNKADVTKAA